MSQFTNQPSMPQMSMAPGSQSLSQALGAQMGQSLDPSLFNGSQTTPGAGFDVQKLASALQSFGDKGNAYDSLPQPVNPPNKQDSYQMYLNAFNAQNKG